jgi:hypothetical protein
MRITLPFVTCALIVMYTTLACRKADPPIPAPIIRTPVPGTINRVPVANAGSDQRILIPTNSITLDGSSSTDPDNNITSYSWSQVSGHPTTTIISPNAIQTQVHSFVEHVYQFELKITDAGGLVSKDTMELRVTAPSEPCAVGRPLVNVQMVPLTAVPNPNLTDNQYKIVGAGNKLLFIRSGGFIYIFDIPSQSWSTTQLSLLRYGAGVATQGNKVYFAGGGFNDGNSIDTVYNTLDIYDAVSDTWSVSSISVAAYCDDGVALGDKIFFPSTTIVQILNTTTGAWTTKNLSDPRFDLSALVAGNKVFLAGGYRQDFTGVSDKVDVYDNSTNNWSQFAMIEPKASFAGVTVSNRIYWGGGRTRLYPNDTVSSKLQVYEVLTGNSTESCLFKSRMDLDAVVKDNKILFFTGDQRTPQNKFDIYDIATNSWSIGVLPRYVQYTAIYSYNNIIYLAGGYVNSSWTPQVWRLEF